MSSPQTKVSEKLQLIPTNAGGRSFAAPPRFPRSLMDIWPGCQGGLSMKINPIFSPGPTWMTPRALLSSKVRPEGFVPRI